MEHQPIESAKPAPPRFAVGQVWERRDGERVTIECVENDGTFCSGILWYEVKHGGRFSLRDEQHSCDLIRLISDPEAADPWPREKRALAAGLRVNGKYATHTYWQAFDTSKGCLKDLSWEALFSDAHWQFRVHPDDEEKMQAIERGERPKAGLCLDCGPTMDNCRYPDCAYGQQPPSQEAISAAATAAEKPPKPLPAPKAPDVPHWRAWRDGFAIKSHDADRGKVTYAGALPVAALPNGKGR